MSEQALMHAFVSQLRELIDFLIKKFPEDRDIFFTKSQMDAAASISPRLVVAHFMSEVSQYLDELESRNDQFFLHLVKTDYDHVLGHMDLSKKWTQLSDADKDYLWTTTQRITKMGSMV
jgi:hypothetical protein